MDQIMDKDSWDEEPSDQTEYITVKDEEMDLDTEDEMDEGYYVLEVVEEEEEVNEEESAEFKPQVECTDEIFEKHDTEDEWANENEQKSISNENIKEEQVEPEEVTEENHVTFDDERMKDTTRTDLFQQPFVLKYLNKHVQAKSQKEHDSLLLENEFESFVDPKSVCRLCMKTEQNIFLRLFYTNNKLTPIAIKLAFLMGKEKVDEDLLPQQICLECSELVSSCYSSVKHFSEGYQILSEVVAEIKKKTHVFHKPGSGNSVQLKIYDKCYEFCPSLHSTTDDKKSNKKQRFDAAANIKCYLCKQNFSPEALKEHMADEHDCHIEYKCTSCDSAFSTLSRLNKHVCPNVDNEHEIDEYNADDDHADSDSDSVISISHTTYETEKKIPKAKSTRKRLVLKENYTKIMASGPKDCRSCKYCTRVFKSTFPEDGIKAHVVSHMNDLENAANLDPFNIILAEHLTSALCYVCTFCEMPKRSPSQLKEHLNFYCSTFANKFQFKIRDRRRHGKTRGKPVCCKTCADKKLYTKKEYTKHVKENHPELVYKCACCPRSYLSRCELSYHNKKMHLKPQNLDEKENAKMKKIKKNEEAGEKPSFLCEFCSRECKSKSGYRQHVLKSHFSTKEPKSKRNFRKSKRRRINMVQLECPICKAKLYFKGGQEGLEFHIMKHNSPTGKIECCNREYVNYVKYKTHMSSHSRSWPCKSCGSEFKSYISLQDHVASTHSKCQDCSYIAKNLDEFMQHRNECTGGNVMCTICNILFSTKKDLMCHKRQCHWDECCATMDTTCDFPEPILCCGKKFTKKWNLKSHIAKHRDTVCKTCGDVLKSKLALQNHNATHHRQGVRCTYCSKTFCNGDSLKYHMLKHTQGRIYKCPCGLSFYTEADVHKHQRSRKTPCVGSMIQQAPGMSEISVVQVKAGGTEEVEWAEI